MRYKTYIYGVLLVALIVGTCAEAIKKAFFDWRAPL